MTQQYVCIKLTNGEQLLAILQEDDGSSLHLHFPFLVRTFSDFSPNENKHYEHVTANPWCQFVDQKAFIISKSHVLFVGEMHPLMGRQYLKMINEYAQDTQVRDTADGQLEAVDDDDSKLTLADVKEHVRKVREMLEAKYSATSFDEDIEEEYGSSPTFVKGNNRLH